MGSYGVQCIRPTALQAARKHWHAEVEARTCNVDGLHDCHGVRELLCRRPWHREHHVQRHLHHSPPFDDSTELCTPAMIQLAQQMFSHVQVQAQMQANLLVICSLGAL
jgi:hypothetical protein